MLGKAYKAVIIGGSGEVGGHVLKTLLSSPNCTHITSIGRKKLEFPEDQQGLEKLSQFVVDMDKLEQEAKDLVKDHEVAFIALGVGRPSKETEDYLKKVEVGYNTAFAKLCKNGGTKHISFLSSPGVSHSSWIPVLRVKAQLYDNLKELNFTRTSFFCPTVIMTPQARYGWVDSFYMNLWKGISPILPSKYKGATSESIGKAMVLNAELTEGTGVEELYWTDFQRVLRLKDPKADPSKW
jgi:putative NADH-flavin reductase